MLARGKHGLGAAARPRRDRRGRPPTMISSDGPPAGLVKLHELERENALLRDVMEKFAAADRATRPPPVDRD